jgi:hypothetical protein
VRYLPKKKGFLCGVQSKGKQGKAGFKSKKLLPSRLGFAAAVVLVFFARCQGQDSHADRVLLSSGLVPVLFSISTLLNPVPSCAGQQPTVSTFSPLRCSSFSDGLTVDRWQPICSPLLVRVLLRSYSSLREKVQSLSVVISFFLS